MKLTRRLTLAAFAGALALGTAIPAFSADLIAIITPAHDNPVLQGGSRRRRSQGEGTRLRGPRHDA